MFKSRLCYTLLRTCVIIAVSLENADAQTGACCYDITDDALRYEICVDEDENSCKGIFHVGTTCGDVQACCLPFGNDILCFDEINSSGSPLCCLDSDGVPQGEGTACADVDCDASVIPAVSGSGLVVATLLLIIFGSLIIRSRVQSK